jgi:alpha-tubulin suppressor-like RCC1 family protein
VTTALPPSNVDTLRGSHQIVRASGGCFWCALRESHELTCEPSPYTQKGIVMPSVSTVAAGSDHACATLLDGSVWCWGSNARGELGRRTATERDAEPAPVQWAADSVVQPCKSAGVSR